MSILAIAGFIWQFVVTIGDPCGRCVRFDMNWKGKHQSILVEKYGWPDDIYDIDEDRKRGNYRISGGEYLERWTYRNPEMRFIIKHSDRTITDSYRNDHTCPPTLFGL